jgi:murein DD-endopeptidase MepM/ murein hydrolase activator NlpD
VRKSKRKLYYYSAESLSLTEAKGARVRIAAKAILGGIVVGLLLFEMNSTFDDALGLGVKRASVLAAENAMLMKQLRSVAARLEGLEKQLAFLNERGNELRLMADLPRIDEETRMVGVGGTDDRIDFGGSQTINRQLQSILSTLSRAEREAQLQRTSYGDVARTYEENSVRFSHLPAIKPMEGFLSSKFGMRYHPIFLVRKHHEGIDIVNESGTPVYASGNGRVVTAGRSLGGYGIMVMIDHGYGYTTVYGHLQKALVREGQQVKRGDLIGRCGRTGIATNSHLHYEVRLNGVQQNPIDYFFDDFNYNDYHRSLAATGY